MGVTTHLHLVLRFRMSGATHPFPLYDSITCTYKDNFVFLNLCTIIGAVVKISVPDQSGIITVIEYSLSWLRGGYFVLNVYFLF